MNIFAILSLTTALILVGSGLPTPEETYKRFDGHRVYRVIPTADEHLDLLRTMEGWPVDGVRDRSYNYLLKRCYLTRNRSFQTWEFFFI